MYRSLENLLKRTNKLSIITWFMPPSTHQTQWTNDGFNNAGAYCNTYDHNTVNQIIQNHNFTQIVHTRQGSQGNTLYIYELHKKGTI